MPVCLSNIEMDLTVARKTTMNQLPAPFLKWVGGKGQLIPRLTGLMPRALERYCEPFVGGGAVFFHLRGSGLLTGPAVIADVNEELVNAYCVVQSDVERLIESLQGHKAQHSMERYYTLRAKPYSEGVEGAARTIYLNKTGYNGLYRVNRSGQFNVPLGSYKNPTIFEAGALRLASDALRNTAILAQCFRKTIDAAGPGDFLYLDPPYIPLSVTANFTSYAPAGFVPKDQEDLAACVRAADRRGVKFVLSNSYTDEVCRLYCGFQIHRASAFRRINCDGSKRGPIDEAIVCNFEISSAEISAEFQATA